MDNFEQLLKGQSLREVPPEWRAEILASASVEARQPATCPTGWRGWLWPSPYAWGGLAAVWLVIIGLNVAAQPGVGRQHLRGPVLTEREVLIAMAERQRELEAFFPKSKVKSALPPAARQESPGVWLGRRERDGTEIA